MSDRSEIQAKVDGRLHAEGQSSDNIAHAMAGAGGGLLSMAITFVLPRDEMVRYTN